MPEANADRPRRTARHTRQMTTTKKVKTFFASGPFSLVSTFFLHCLDHQRQQRPHYQRNMISNTSAIPTLHGGQISLDRIKARTHTSNRRTKIVCTIGPACWSKENMATLMDAGMNVARFNFSHGDHQGHGAVLDRLRQVASERSRNIAGMCVCIYIERERLCFWRSRKTGVVPSDH